MMGHDYFYDHQKATRQKGRRHSRRRGHVTNSTVRLRDYRARRADHATDAICQEKAHLGLASRVKVAD